MTTLIVFSHLRWAFVFQRPQHLLTRISRNHRVVYVEEPVRTAGPAWLKCTAVTSSLTVLVPHTPCDAPGFHDDQLPILQQLIAEYVDRERIADHVAWLYTPMALPLLAPLNSRVVVYDCMDELAAFDYAPRQLQQRESALFRRADLVITGGPALFEAKRGRHPNVHLLPSSVDSRHYAPENLERDGAHHREVQAIQGSLPRPRLGFFGVIDERLDVALIGSLARSHPEWQLVMVGPVVKIDPNSLPRQANILWTGMQPYERLPYFVDGWDLCLMPFAINRATQFISPTKTLEYFAGQRPVVSTPVRDVVRLYGEALDIGAGDEFIRACERALGRTQRERTQQLEAMERIVAQSSWDVSALRVQALIEQAIVDAQARETTSPAPVVRAPALTLGIAKLAGEVRSSAS
jgi:glycosyltransferase involved in cell wall biosynthesis